MTPTVKRQAYCLLLALGVYFNSNGQSIGIGTGSPHISAIIDISHASKGILLPRMTTTAINNIANPAKGLLVYDTVAHQLKVNMGSQAAPSWQSIAARSSWTLAGNSGTNASTNFLGTTDNRPLRFRVNNITAGELNPANGNVLLGLRAGENNSSAYSNIAIGPGALRMNAVLDNIVAIGDSALYNLTIGDGSNVNYGLRNTAIGSKALISASTAFGNTAIGFHTLYYNTTGWGNTAVGSEALLYNAYAAQNSAFGEFALKNNSSGSHNTGLGYASLLSNVSGHSNTAVGYSSMAYNNSGHSNTAIGVAALQISQGASYNTAVGHYAGQSSDLGWNNTLVGAGSYGGYAGIYNIVAIGQGTVCTGASTARIGNTGTVSIGGQVGWSSLSDGRYKKNIKEGVTGLDFIMKLRPVMYQMDVAALDTKLKVNHSDNPMAKKAAEEQEQNVYTGFIAQEVEEAAKQSGFDFSGVDKPKNENDIYGLRYGDFVVPIVKAMQEQQDQIETLKKDNAGLKKLVGELLTRMEAFEKKK